MSVWGFLVGLIIGFVPIFLILKYFRGKFLFVENIYAKGALFGLIFWLLIMLFLYIEARFSLLGILTGESGVGTVMVLTTSLQGFITAGIISAFLVKKLTKTFQKS